MFTGYDQSAPLLIEELKDIGWPMVNSAYHLDRELDKEVICSRDGNRVKFVSVVSET